MIKMLKFSYLQWGLLLITLSQMVQCAGQKSLDSHFTRGWQWDGGTSAHEILLALEGQQAAVKTPAVVGVTGRGLIGRTLPEGQAWNYTGEVDVLPSIVGNLVAFSGGGSVTGLDVRTGEKIFSIPSEKRRLEGLGYDGQYALLLLVDSHAARHDELVAVGPQGQVLSRAATTSRLGTPAVIGGIGLVPWDGQYISVFQLQDGKEIGRMLVRDAIHSVVADNDQVLVMGRGVQRLNQDLVDHPGATSLRLDLPAYPGEPVWPIDGSKPRPARAQPIMILTHPTWESDQGTFSNHTYGLTYHDLVAGYDTHDHHLKWVAHFPAAVSGGHANNDSMTLCLENGQISQMRLKDGYHEEVGTLGSPLKACAVSGLNQVTQAGQPDSLAEQVHAALAEVGPSMFALQTRLVDEIAAKPGADYTRVLLKVAQSPTTTSLLRAQVKKALALRRDGAQVMIDELIASAPEAALTAQPEQAATSPAETQEEIAAEIAAIEGEDDGWANEGESVGTEAAANDNPKAPEMMAPSSLRRHHRPPLIEVAQALTQMQARSGATALSLHLNTTGLEAKNALAITNALLVLGDSNQVSAMRKFIEDHKNTGGTPEQKEALTQATFFLYQHDPFVHSYLKGIMDSSLTHQDVRLSLERGLYLMKQKEQQSPAASQPQNSEKRANESL